MSVGGGGNKVGPREPSGIETDVSLEDTLLGVNSVRGAAMRPDDR